MVANMKYPAIDFLHKKSRCPFCGLASCSCAQRTHAGHVLLWRLPAAEETEQPTFGLRLLSKLRSPLSLLTGLWLRFRSLMDPTSSPISPLAWLYWARVANYYRRTVNDPSLAREWGEHYLADLGLKQGARVLDHGCGKGRHAAILQQLGYEVYAQDIYPHSWWEHMPSVGFQVVPPSAPMLPWADASFDLILDVGVIGHLSPLALQGYAREVRRALRPGGRWLVLEANIDSYIAPHTMRHYGRLHSLPDFLELVDESGFREINHSFEGFYAPRLPMLVNSLRKALGPWPFDMADYKSWLAHLLPPKRRGLWLLRLEMHTKEE